MKTLLLTLVSAFAMAAQTATTPAPQPKLNTEEIQALNQSATAAQVADLQKQVAELRQQIVILRACWTRGIAEKDCQFQADGTLKSTAKPEATAKER
jgi:TolA-binding protein